MENFDSNNQLVYFEKAICPVCYSIQNKLVFDFEYQGDEVLKKINFNSSYPRLSIFQCLSCEHHYANPQLTEKVLEEYYSLLDSTLYSNDRLSRLDNYIYRNKEIIRSIEEIKNGGRLLEVGCGLGYFLSYLNKNKWDCYGVEPSSIAYHKAVEISGAKIFNGFLDSDTYIQKFDVIVLVDVIEHLKDPKKLLDLLFYYLNNNGLIFISTGNILSNAARISKQNWSYFGSWEHISFFSPVSMTSLLSGLGYSEISVKKVSLTKLTEKRSIRNVFISFMGILLNRFSLLKYFVLRNKNKKVYFSFGKDHINVTARKK